LDETVPCAQSTIVTFLILSTILKQCLLRFRNSSIEHDDLSSRLFFDTSELLFTPHSALNADFVERDPPLGPFTIAGAFLSQAVPRSQIAVGTDFFLLFAKALSTQLDTSPFSRRPPFLLPAVTSRRLPPLDPPTHTITAFRLFNESTPAPIPTLLQSAASSPAFHTFLRPGFPLLPIDTPTNTPLYLVVPDARATPMSHIHALSAGVFPAPALFTLNFTSGRDAPAPFLRLLPLPRTLPRHLLLHTLLHLRAPSLPQLTVLVALIIRPALL